MSSLDLHNIWTDSNVEFPWLPGDPVPNPSALRLSNILISWVLPFFRNLRQLTARWTPYIAFPPSACQFKHSWLLWPTVLTLEYSTLPTPDRIFQMVIKTIAMWSNCADFHAREDILSPRRISDLERSLSNTQNIRI